MDTKVFRIPEYHKMVWRFAWRETCNDLFGDIKSLVGDFIIAIVSGLVYAIWSYFRQDTMIDWLGVSVSVVCGFVAWGVILFLVNLFWKVPAKLYRQKETEANLPSWKDVEIKEFEFPSTSGLGVGLEIISHKPKTEVNGIIQDPYINQVMPKLTRISNDDEPQSFPPDLSSLLPIMQGAITFQKTDIIKSPEQLKRDNQSHNVISVARWNEDEAWIKIGKKGNEGKVILKEGVAYLVEIEIRDAMINTLGKMFYICKISCNLLCHKDKDGSRKVDLKIDHRYPVYEQ